MKVFKIVPVVALVAAFSGCVNDDVYNTPDLSGYCTTIPVTAAVSDIFTSALPAWPDLPVQYTDDKTIEAYVTSSDEGGTFYKSISFVSVDGAMGFSIPVDNYNLYTQYEPGRKVFIKLKDLYLIKNNGYQAGGLYNGNTPDDPDDDAVGRLSGATYQNVIFRSCDKVDEETLVNHMTIAEALDDANLNKLIEFENVQLSSTSVGKKYYDPSVNSIGGATNHTLNDDLGGSVILRISEFANFAGDVIPNASGTIRGVLTKFGSTYQFLPRTIHDIKLAGDRFIPHAPIGGTAVTFDSTLNEPFTSYATNFTEFPKYVNDRTEGNRYWQVKEFSSNKYIEMTSFGSNGSSINAKAYLFVPVNFDAASTMTFKSQFRFMAGQTLKVYYVTGDQYAAGDPFDVSTFADITASFNIQYPASGSQNDFLQNATFNIPPSLTGNGFFVFEHVGTTTITTTARIDDIVIN
ncbi:DUF5689 domain-containing protein [Flavobacterium caeni]|uniref:DUF5689 domain-containing protein n=1 Tax=Flavobacterium caeni TaxID=490189 RepID=A0A1G5GV20_9FLAO|nr:DUF5689 domain-containing protein [Flavobacterium caeni]SCY55413.1 hypothetical protein SAMN02927903_01641 [Flavobacterium caeni]